MSSRNRPPFAAFLAAGLACALAGCYDKDDYAPTEANVNQIVVLESVSGATSLPADGFSRLPVQARLLGDPAFARRTVIFSVDNGTLDGGQAPSDCPACREVVADSTGRARVDVIAGTRVGTAIVSARLKEATGIRVDLALQLVAPAAGDVVRFVAAPATVPADGATLTTFTVEVAGSVPQAQRTVRFAATAGSFSSGGTTPIDVPVDAGNRASADFKSPATIGTARITATVAGVTRETAVSFARALPGAIVVTANPPVLMAAANAQTTITATLLRDVGQVTDGAVVTFSARDASGTALGLFTNVTRSASGSASAVFLPQTTTPGRVTITVGVEGSRVTGSVDIELTP
ncbi:MAG TPA: hypothetical protein VF017_09880 [Thermoanaerobaculia bacterium]|nr:hypothetical protein [Thermoanaerobaculia bacterium]